MPCGTVKLRKFQFHLFFLNISIQIFLGKLKVKHLFILIIFQVIKELIEKDYRKKFDVTVQNQDFGKRTFESDSLACKFKHKNKFFLAFSTRNDNQVSQFNLFFKENTFFIEKFCKSQGIKEK